MQLLTSRRRDRLRRARPRAVRRPGLAHGRGADARLRQRGGARAHARDRRAAPLEPLARRAVAQGRDVGQRAGASRRCARLRRRRAARARRARRPGLPHRRAHVLPQRRPRAAAPHEALPALERTLAARAAERPEGSYTVELLDDPAADRRRRSQEEAEEVARAAREESDERVDEEAADVLYHLPCCCARAARPGRRRGGARWPSPLSSPPSTSRARGGPRARARAQPRPAAPHLHRRLRDAGLGLPEAARRAARPSCSSRPSRASASGATRSSASRPRKVVRWSPATPATLRAGRRRGRARTARRRCRPARRSPAARSASSATTSCAPSSRSASPTPTCSACPTWR